MEDILPFLELYYLLFDLCAFIYISKLGVNFPRTSNKLLPGTVLYLFYNSFSFHECSIFLPQFKSLFELYFLDTEIFLIVL